MEKKKLIIGIFAFVVLIAGASLLYGQLSKDFTPDSIAESQGQGQVSEEEEEGQQLQMAPDFTVYDEDGNAVTLHQYFGKPIVLNFWASWCGPCKNEMPDFEEMYKARGDEIQFLMVNCTGGRETLESAKSFLADSGYTFPVFFDTDLDASMAYGTSSIPMTFFLDEEGYLAAYAQGSITADLLRQGIDMITE